MLRVIVKNGKIEKALKVLKNKVRNTKQREELNSRKEHTKKSVTKRKQKLKATYIQKKYNNDD